MGARRQLVLLAVALLGGFAGPSNQVAIAKSQDGQINAICRGAGGAIGEPRSVEFLQAMSIAAKIRGVIRSEIDPNSKQFLELERQKFREKFGEKPFSCKLTTRPDGTIAELSVFESSGSTTIDSKALQLVSTAAPFRTKLKVSNDLRYLIHLPSLKIVSLKESSSDPE